MKRRLARMMGLPLMCLALGAIAADPPNEAEPELTLSTFDGVPSSVSGAGYRIGATVPVKGYNGQFTVRTDYGNFVADGSPMLRRRIAEMPAVVALDKLSTSDVFVDALGKSAAKSAQAIGRAVTNPVDTAKAVPAGLGRFFGSVGDSAKNVVSGDGGKTTNAAKDAIGINKAKRQIAKSVGVDPYSANPLIAKRLDELAIASFAGGVTLDVALAVSTAGVATALSATKAISGLAWDLPPEDIRKRKAQALEKLGVSSANRAALLDNPVYTPSFALAFVNAAEKLGVREGLDGFVKLAGDAASESEAEFYVAQLALAKQYGEVANPVVRIETPGPVGVFRTKDGTAFVPAALDYAAWTAGVERFAKTPHQGATHKVLWLTGRASDAAKAGLAQQGWTLREAAKYE